MILAAVNTLSKNYPNFLPAFLHLKSLKKSWVAQAVVLPQNYYYLCFLERDAVPYYWWNVK